MAFTPAVTWNGGTSSATGFNASPAGSADPRQGDDRIRELKVALAERLTREHFFALAGGSSAGQEGNLRAGAGRIYHQSSAPTTKPDGNALDADDVGRLYAQSNTTALRVRTSNSTWVGVTANTLQDQGGSGSSNILYCKVIPIGDWNMAATANLSVAHGLTLTKIKSVAVELRDDADNMRIPFGAMINYFLGAQRCLGFSLDGTNVNLRQSAVDYWFQACSTVLSLGAGSGGASADWDATGYNRGWITIWYTP